MCRLDVQNQGVDMVGSFWNHSMLPSQFLLTPDNALHLLACDSIIPVIYLHLHMTFLLCFCVSSPLLLGTLLIAFRARPKSRMTSS